MLGDLAFPARHGALAHWGDGYGSLAERPASRKAARQKRNRD